MKRTYLSIDLEMSGQTPGIHDIIQIGAVLLDSDFNEISTFETLVYPEFEEDFDPDSKRIHGISRLDLEDAPSLEDSLEDLEDWVRDAGEYPFRNALKDVKICGQGINNDISFLKASYEHINLTWPFAFQFVDLQDLSMLYFHILKHNNIEHPSRLGLDVVGEFLEQKRERVCHNALEDAQLTGACIKEIFERCSHLKVE